MAASSPHLSRGLVLHLGVLGMLLIDAMANLRASGCWQVASTSIFSVLCQLGRHRHALFPLLAWVADLCDGEPKAASNDVILE